MANEVDLSIVTGYKELPPKDGVIPCNYLALPHRDIPALVVEYVAAMETQETNDWCRCEWIIHPDDVKVADNACRECGHERTHDIHNADREPHYDHAFRGKRMRRGDQAPDCPVHTKEGFLMYFFEWVFTREGN